MAVIETWIKTDLKSIVKVTPIHGILFSQDNMANLIGVELLDGGEPAAVSGSVSANVLRANGTTVAVAGTLSDNKATVTLPQAAYAYPGMVAIVIKLTTDSVVTTIGAIQAVVYKSSTDTIVDPGTIIPSVQDLIAAIDAAVASIPPDYSELTGEVSDLKNATSEKSYNLFNKSTIAPGNIDASGNITSSTTLWYSDFIDVDEGAFILSFANQPSDRVIRIAYYNSSKVFQTREVASLLQDVCEIKRPDNTYKYIRVSCYNGFESVLQIEKGVIAHTYRSFYIGIDPVSRESVETVENSIVDQTRNLFNRHTITSETINDTGMVLTNDTLWCSDYIDVNGGAFVCSFSTPPSDNVMRIAYYDATHSFISREVAAIGSGVHSIVRGSNTNKYIRVVCANGFEEYLQIETGNAATEYIPHFTAEDFVIRETTYALKDAITKETRNIFDKETITSGTINDQGAIGQSDTLWYSDFIDVDGNAFTLSFATQPGDGFIRIAHYDSSKQFESRKIYSELSNTLTDLINTSKYIRIIAYNGFENYLQVEKGMIPTEYINHTIYENDETKTTKRYNVCIVGGGAAGISAAYALKDSGLSVCLIEKEPYLGGTHTQGWVNSIITGFNPSYFDDLAREMIGKHQASLLGGGTIPLSFDDSLAANWLATHNTVDGTSYNIVVNPRAFSLKYYSDLNGKIDVMLNTTVYKAFANNGNVTSIETTDGTVIIADQYIDCSAFNVILLTLNGKIYYGGDSKTRYQSEYGFTEADAADVNYDTVNISTLMYRITEGTEDLSGVTAQYADFGAPSLWNQDPKNVYMITFGTDLRETYEALTIGPNALYNRLSPNMIKQWKTMKNGTFLNGKLPHNQTTYKFNGVAPMLGVRELGRAGCERMLHESELMVQITRQNMASAANNLDKMIAIGGHHIDIYADPYLTDEKKAEISVNIKKYGVPYGCIIPKNFKNLLIASKGCGTTHIAQSAFRLTKYMMQIGSVAGYAARIFAEDGLADFRDVDVVKLQSDDYTNLVGMVDELNA